MKSLVLSFAIAQMLQGHADMSAPLYPFLENTPVPQSQAVPLIDTRAYSQAPPVVNAPMRMAPEVQVHPRVGCLGFLYGLRDQRIYKILPCSDLERFPFIQPLDIVIWPHMPFTGPIGSYAKLQILTGAKVPGSPGNGHIQTIWLQFRDPRLFDAPMPVPVNNPNYYHEVERRNEINQ